MTACLTSLYLSLVSGRSGCDFENSIFNLVLLAGIFTSCVNALRSMLHDFTDNKSTSVQVMAWCRQATSHYPRQSWSSSMSSHMVSQWTLCHFIKYLTYTNSLLFSTHGPTKENNITGQNKPQQICIIIAWDILYVKICAGKWPALSPHEFAENMAPSVMTLTPLSWLLVICPYHKVYYCYMTLLWYVVNK